VKFKFNNQSVEVNGFETGTAKKLFEIKLANITLTCRIGFEINFLQIEDFNSD